MPGSPSDRYAALVAAGEIERDAAQEAVVAKLAQLEARLATHRLARKSSSLGWLFARQEQKEPIKGLYLHGEVGRGKTMLMDLFFEQSTVIRKRRAHFHEFMADVHERVHAYRQALKRGEVDGDDPIAPVAAAIAEQAWLLCFDEFHVTDIADAMILGRLFTQLFERGVVVVATSNVTPDDLYRDGLNRDLFLPFIAMLRERMTVTRVPARTDFRMEKLAAAPIWYVPDDTEADACMDRAWRKLTGGSDGGAYEITNKGRVIEVPRAALGVARFSFADLCERPLGALDYLKIAREFHTLLIDHVPVMDFAKRNEVKRFITLIDTVYDQAVKLVASAQAEPDALYPETDGAEAMQFKRTASRLYEMRSDSYLSLPHGRRDSPAQLHEGIVET